MNAIDSMGVGVIGTKVDHATIVNSFLQFINNHSLMYKYSLVIMNVLFTGAYKRQSKLREMGVQQILQQLLGSNDAILFDK